MFSKLSLVAAVLPLVYSLQIFAPENPTSQGEVTIKWTPSTADSFDVFSIYLFNTAFNDNFGIANNVDPAAMEKTLTLPVVPARDGYTVAAVNVGNISDIYSVSPPFSIGAVVSTSASGSSTSSSSGASSATSSRASSTSPVSTRASTSGTGTGTGTGSPSPSDTAPTTFNNPAAATLPLGMTSGGAVAFMASVLAGAAMIGF